VIGHGDTMVLPDVPATIFEGEAEVAVIIGKRASHVRASEAMDYVFGYTNFIDGSARGGLGRLRLHVRDDLKRTWARETRLDRQEKKLEGTTPQLTGKYAPEQ
jgi:2-keto-4-pentenoate hydratase/2-oxohepta-3-ene-1,7-dioic acid hydratase in catechol pathway